MEEQWKDIKEFEGLYQISNLGRIRSLGFDIHHKGRILKPRLDSRGFYYLISLHKDKKLYHKLVHRLVAEAFIPNPKKLPCVNHINENKRDNHADNLEWCDYSYNAKYGSARYKSVRNRTAKGLFNGERQISMYDKDGKFIRTFRSCFEAARILGGTRTMIRHACKFYDKGHNAYGFYFKFNERDKG